MGALQHILIEDKDTRSLTKGPKSGLCMDGIFGDCQAMEYRVVPSRQPDPLLLERPSLGVHHYFDGPPPSVSEHKQ